MFALRNHLLWINWGLFLLVVTYLIVLQVLRVRQKRTQQDANLKALNVISALDAAKPVDEVLPEIAASAAANQEAQSLEQTQKVWAQRFWVLGILVALSILYVSWIWRANKNSTMG